MAKKTKLSQRELMLVIGVILILIGVIGIGNFVSLILILIGGYLLYDNMKKK